MGELPHRPNDIQGRGVAGVDASRVSDDLRRWVGAGDDEPRAYPSPWVRVFVFGLFTLVAAMLVVTVLVALGGCAFSPFPDRGGGVLGIPIGEDGTVAPGALEGVSGLVLTALGVGGTGGIGLLVAKGIRVAIKAARMEGESDGWVQREQAASVQAPLPGPVAYGGGGAGVDRSGVSVTETVVKT